MTKVFRHILLLISGVAMLSSCVNLRYTDYGKPFDFLKAKNNYHASKHIKADTANIFKSELKEKEGGLAQLDSPSEEDAISKYEAVGDFVEASDSTTDHTLIEQVYTTSVKIGLKYERKPLMSKKEVVFQAPEKAQVRNSSKSLNQTKRGDVWKFILKWLLIGLAVAVVFVGLIVGLYYLLLWLGGAIVAVVVLTLILIALEVFCDIDLFWLFNFF